MTPSQYNDRPWTKKDLGRFPDPLVPGNDIHGSWGTWLKKTKIVQINCQRDHEMMENLAVERFLDEGIVCSHPGPYWAGFLWPISSIWAFFLPSWAKLIAQLKWFIKFMDNSYCNHLDISMHLKVNGLVLYFYLKMRKYDQKLRGKFPLIPHDRRHVYSAKRKLEGEGWEGKASKEDQLVWSLLTPYLSY